jgi:hypothetical protein
MKENLGATGQRRVLRRARCLRRQASARWRLRRRALQKRGVGSKFVHQVLDSLYVLESAMRHFFIRAEMGKNAGPKRKKLTEITSKLRFLLRWWRHIGMRD